jgi:hypothetical protein
MLSFGVPCRRFAACKRSEMTAKFTANFSPIVPFPAIITYDTLKPEIYYFCNCFLLNFLTREHTLLLPLFLLFLFLFLFLLLLLLPLHYSPL